MPKQRILSKSGPYLQAALFCEYLLDEKDNVKSIIRIIDRVDVQARGPDVSDKMPAFERDIIAFLAFKAGDAHGPVHITLTLTRSSGVTDDNPVWQGSLHFEGGTRGNNLILRIRTRFDEPGPYWYNVYVGDDLVTRMPFEIRYTTMRTRELPQG